MPESQPPPRSTSLRLPPRARASEAMASHLLPTLLLLLALAVSCSAAGSATSPYIRPPPRETLSTPLADDADGTIPQQVHISMVGANRVRVTWITEDDAPATVDYGLQEGKYGESSTGSTSTYTFSALYTSGKIHEAVIGPLDPDSVYYYRCSGSLAREFSFKTPPASLPIKFAVIGDLGQTGWTNSTLNHISQSNYDLLLLPGDLSYADLNQPSWDSYARLVEPLASSRPWMVTEGNHEIETIPLIESTPFKPYNARYHMPYEESASPSNLFYSFDTAGGAIHVLMLGSYTDFAASSDQFKWLQADLAKLDRSKTKWLFALIHAPWYNSNKAHQGDGDDMRKAIEETLYAARVDAVFAGHVHAYERFVFFEAKFCNLWCRHLCITARRINVDRCTSQSVTGGTGKGLRASTFTHSLASLCSGRRALDMGSCMLRMAPMHCGAGTEMTMMRLWWLIACGLPVFFPILLVKKRIKR